MLLITCHPDGTATAKRVDDPLYEMHLWEPGCPMRYEYESLLDGVIDFAPKVYREYTLTEPVRVDAGELVQVVYEGGGR